MAKKFSILDAVDNLSSMAELEEEELAGDVSHMARNWLDPRDEEKTYANVKETFKAVHNYLEHVYKDEHDHLQKEETQKGIKAIMSLADEAAAKISRCFKQVTLSELDDLKAFYQEKIASRFKEALEEEEAWQEEWGSGELDIADVARVGLKDLETVKRDREYELFYIKKEDGRPFFNKNLIRHIKLVHDFDELVIDLEGVDPLLKMPLIQENDVHETALEIKKMADKSLREFYKIALKFKDDPLVSIVSRAMMALFLTTNPHNLTGKTKGKTALAYFKDFQTFVREALESPEYKELSAHPPAPTERLPFCTLALLQAIAHAFFVRSAHEKPLTHFLKGLLPKRERTYSVWNDILDDHEALSDYLTRFPNGPLFKTIDVFHEQIASFDPILHDNYPTSLFQLNVDGNKLQCQRLPCPTKQEVINKAEITEEFRNYLRTLLANERHLIINLQERTKWEEHARSRAIENLQNEAEFTQKLIVATLPKQTDFYLQNEPYIKINDASEFLANLTDQITSGEDAGFFFPPKIKKEILTFSSHIIPLIHSHFFSSKPELSRKMRLDFIEIFYHFLTLKLIDLVQPTHLSLSCKDAVDTGAVSSAGLYAFTKLLSGETKWNEDERDHLFYMLFGPAMQVRQRAVDIQRLGREISALSAMHLELEEKKDAILKDFLPLYSFKEFSLLAA